MPTLGTLGIFPPPTPEMYTNPVAYQFIIGLMQAQYIMILMAVVNLLSLIALWTKREGLAVLLQLPIILNILGFHAFLDGGLLSPGAIGADVFALILAYFFWNNRAYYTQLLQKQ